jgi:hypothetical protein
MSHFNVFGDNTLNSFWNNVLNPHFLFILEAIPPHELHALEDYVLPVASS